MYTATTTAFVIKREKKTVSFKFLSYSRAKKNRYFLNDVNCMSFFAPLCGPGAGMNHDVEPKRYK